MKVVFIAPCATCGKPAKVARLLECGARRAYVCEECLSKNWLIEKLPTD